MAYPRIIYGTNNRYIDFERGIKDLRLPLDDKITVNESDAGIKEFLHYYQKQIIEFNIENYTTGFDKILRALYEYCRLGNSLKLIIDPDILFFIDFENGIYSNDKIEGVFSYDATGEYYFEDDRGLLIKNAGYPRYVNGKFGKGMIFENNYDNLQTYFNDFGTWDQTNVTVNTDTSETDDPVGTNVADKLTPTGSGGQGCSISLNDPISLNTGENITTSIYLKSQLANLTVYIRLYGYSTEWEEIGSEIVTVTPEWQRFHCTVVGAEDNYTWIRPEIAWTNNSSYIMYAFYSQLQKLCYPVSVQKLTDGTGSSDICYWDVSDLINQRLTKFSMGLWAKLPYNHDEHEDNVYLAYITQSGASGVHSTIVLEADGDIRGEVGKVDATTIQAVASADGYIVTDEWFYIVLTVDSTISNGVKVYINGILIATATNYPFALNNGSRFYVGSYSAGSNNCDGIIDDVIIEAKTLSATEILRRYNLGKSLGIERNIFNSVFLKEFNYNSILRNGVPRKSVSLSFEEELT